MDRSGSAPPSPREARIQPKAIRELIDPRIYGTVGLIPYRNSRIDESAISVIDIERHRVPGDGNVEDVPSNAWLGAAARRRRRKHFN